MNADRSHCPTNENGQPQQYFSPVAPPEYCMQVHQVPEPSSLFLVLLALLIVRQVRKA